MKIPMTPYEKRVLDAEFGMTDEDALAEINDAYADLLARMIAEDIPLVGGCGQEVSEETFARAAAYLAPEGLYYSDRPAWTDPNVVVAQDDYLCAVAVRSEIAERMLRSSHPAFLDALKPCLSLQTARRLLTLTVGRFSQARRRP